MSSVVIFGRGEKPVTTALMNGARAADLRPIMQRPHSDTITALVRDASAVFVEGAKGLSAAIMAAYQAIGIPVFIIELPRLRNVLGADRNAYGDLYGIYRDSLHDLPLRVGNRVVAEGIIHDRAATAMVVCGQKPGDVAHGMDTSAMDSWTRDVITLTRLHYQLPVIFRPHPRDTRELPSDWYGADGLSPSAVSSLREALGSAAGLVTYNSTAGIDAIDAGVPVFYTAHESLVCYARYAQRLCEPLRPLTAWERRAFLMRCGASQWHLAQMEDGSMHRALILGQAMPSPELVEPEPPVPEKVTKPRPKSREVIANGV